MEAHKVNSLHKQLSTNQIEAFEDFWLQGYKTLWRIKERFGG